LWNLIEYWKTIFKSEQATNEALCMLCTDEPALHGSALGAFSDHPVPSIFGLNHLGIYGIMMADGNTCCRQLFNLKNLVALQQI